MHILIAPNAFKHSLDATAAAEAIREGLQQSRLKCTCACFPVGDGGDGTAHLLMQKLGGTMVSAAAHDPLGRRITAAFGLIHRGRTAVIDMADASGLRLLRPEEFDPLQASTLGTGELIRCALDRGVNRILLGAGGSATVDGATGILRALGVRFLDARGADLAKLPESLVRLDSIVLAGLDPRAAGCEWTVLCDVENFLLGEAGAAKVFGPQKGADAATVKELESGLTRLRDVLFRQTGRDLAVVQHGGAAGGAAAGLQGFLQAKLVKGIEHFLEITGFDAALQKADLVITGEGSLDEQTLQGKGPFGVAFRAKKRNIPVIGLAGKVSPAAKTPLQDYFDTLLTIGDGRMELEQALRNTAPDLRRTARKLGNRLALNAASGARAKSLPSGRGRAK